MKYKTEQESFWAGEFGDQYISRNQSENLLASNISFFSKALQHANNLKSCIEFGANIGMNLKAIKLLFPKIDLNGIEINKKAFKSLNELIGENNSHNCSIFDFNSKQQFSLSFVKVVLIHINPEMLHLVYKKLYDSSNKYILIAEYYNPKPVSISYRGHSKKLFKRDFAGEFMDSFNDIKLVDYGFVYHRDNCFPQDDINWFLFEKI